MTISKISINRKLFGIEILPILQTLDFEYVVGMELHQETYFCVNGKYFYTKKYKYGDFIEYRLIRRDLPFYEDNRYYDCVSEKCFITYNGYNNDFKVDKYYIQYYGRTVLPKNRCIFCDTRFRNSHSIKTKNHKTNYNNFLREISISSGLNSDCIDNIMLFLL